MIVDKLQFGILFELNNVQNAQLCIILFHEAKIKNTNCAKIAQHIREGSINEQYKNAGIPDASSLDRVIDFHY